MYPKAIQKLIDLFSKFPTVGPRTAARFVFYLLKLSKEEINDLINSILMARDSVKLCNFCFNPFDASGTVPAKPAGTVPEDGGELCPICQNPSRDKTLLCVVEKEIDLISLEKIKKYQGLYFILGGSVSRLKNEEVEKLRTKELLERIETPQKFGIIGPGIKEIIIATNQTPEGQATALYLERRLKPLNKKVTRLGRGLPVGGELEYSDEETLTSALESRR